MLHLLAFHLPFLDEWAVILVIGLLIFGKKLPEVGRNLGKGIVEFKKGLKGIEEEIEQASSQPTSRVTPTALPSAQEVTDSHKYDPTTGQPLASKSEAIPVGAKFDPFTGKPLEA